MLFITLTSNPEPFSSRGANGLFPVVLSYNRCELTHPPTCCPSLRQPASLRRFFGPTAAVPTSRRGRAHFCAPPKPCQSPFKPARTPKLKAPAHAQHLLLRTDLHCRCVRCDLDYWDINSGESHAHFSLFALFESLAIDDRQGALSRSRDSVELQIISNWS